MLIGAVGFISLIISWFFIKPYLRTREKRIWLLRTYLILIPIAVAGYLIVYFLNKEPDAFNNGMELLTNNKEISAKIGSFESYTFNKTDLSKDTDNPYAFKIELTGSLASIYLSCKVLKDKSGTWHLTEIKQDSLVKAKTDY